MISPLMNRVGLTQAMKFRKIQISNLHPGLLAILPRAGRKASGLVMGLTLALALIPVDALSETITVAVASNFAEPMQSLTRTFEKNSGHQVKLVTGSSGKLFAQINHGAPFDAFFSADQEKPLALVKSNKAVPHSQFTYAIGTLVLWSAENGLNLQNGTLLNAGKFKRLALANPVTAPYGAASIQVLEQLQFDETTLPKRVMGENIAQTYHFVASQNAEVGFVALSQVMKNGVIRSGSAWLIPSELHDPIRQDAVRLYSSLPASERLNRERLTTLFMQFIRSPEAAQLIHGFGYSTETDSSGNAL